jgi:hypothetical protein
MARVLVTPLCFTNAPFLPKFLLPGIDTRLGDSMWNCVQNACCTAVTDSFFANCRTRQILCCEYWHLEEASNNNHPGHLKQIFFDSVVWVLTSKYTTFVFHIIWKCKFFSVHPVYLVLIPISNCNCTNFCNYLPPLQ